MMTGLAAVSGLFTTGQGRGSDDAAGRGGGRGCRRAGRVLLQAAPAGIDLDEVRSHLLTALGVESVHDLHAWTVTSGLPVLSAHVVAGQDALVGSCGGGLLDQLQHCLGGHFNVEHSTIQLEPAGHGSHERDIHP